MKIFWKIPNEAEIKSTIKIFIANNLNKKGGCPESSPPPP
jgi:hypothetical protein